MSTVYPRISGRLGNYIDLNVSFYSDGVLADPYAIRKILIYKESVTDANLVTSVILPPPCDPDYPTPVTREAIADATGQCGTPPGTAASYKTGVYHLIWEVPTDIVVPNMFFDVWCYLPTDPHTSVTSGGTTCDPDDPLLNDESLWQCCCNEFWLYPQSYVCDTGLENIRLSFEPLDVKLYKPEKRKIEVGIVPLPLYDFDYNKIAPIIPMLKGYITVSTDNCETVIEREPMTIGLRPGTYRSTPFVLQYLVDTSLFLKGSYRYHVEVELPNGESRVSPDFILQVN